MDKTHYDTAIAYIDEHMKTRDILDVLDISSKRWNDQFGCQGMGQRDLRRKIGRLYDELKAKELTANLVHLYGHNYPMNQYDENILLRDWTSPSETFPQFLFSFGLWLTNSEIYDSGVNRDGLKDPNYDPEKYPPTGYGGDIEEQFDRLLKQKQYLKCLALDCRF